LLVIKAVYELLRIATDFAGIPKKYGA